MTTAGRPLRGRLSTVLVSALVLAVWLVAAPAGAQPAPPQLNEVVNDFANVFDADTTQQLKDLSQRLQAASGDVMVFATVKTFQPWPDIESYAVKMFENGGKGIGTKGKDNGALILLALDDRKIRIEVGYGLEGFITDGFSGQVSRDTMAPRFRSGDYGGGVLAGATEVARRIAEGRNVTLDLGRVQEEPRRRRPISGFPWIIIVIIILNVINRRGGGGGGGRRWSSGVGAFAAASILSRGGGGWGGGGFGGGGGGGFGGFGGGRSGGGGGGGSW